jgi:hypothetical protein
MAEGTNPDEEDPRPCQGARLGLRRVGERAQWLADQLRRRGIPHRFLLIEPLWRAGIARLGDQERIQTVGSHG